MNGSEFLAKLKALDMYKFIPTVMLTAMCITSAKSELVIT